MNVELLESLKKDVGLSDVTGYEEREGVINVSYLDTDGVARSLMLLKNPENKTLLITAMG